MTSDAPHLGPCLATKNRTKTLSFTDNTRFFELTVDLYADPLTLLAFGGEVVGDVAPKKHVAVNGQIDDIKGFFKQQFIWQFKDICELSGQEARAVDEWLVLNTN
ncbi:hypothetical protein [Agarivorans gilvus]|uniref:Uncharacterized protein n=1 Tax=Agarivorans gilvus TaxID=680279 RepID=A0ABQ1I2B9_9ALTE|nr:hypothetical protein [Agarivorans gilvus]GGB09787.1 hypothetical protein GCM10007414_23970 [Agarivorans gilvus]